MASLLRTLLLIASIVPMTVGGAFAASGTQQKSFLDTVQAPFLTVRNAVVGFFVAEEKAAEMGMAGFVSAVRSDLSGFAEIARAGGFRLSEVHVGASLIPEVAMTFEFVRDISEADEVKVRKRLDQLTGPGGMVQRALILGLLDAGDAAADGPDGFKLAEVEVDVDLIPGFNLVWISDK